MLILFRLQKTTLISLFYTISHRPRLGRQPAHPRRRRYPQRAPPPSADGARNPAQPRPPRQYAPHHRNGRHHLPTRARPLPAPAKHRRTARPQRRPRPRPVRHPHSRFAPLERRHALKRENPPALPGKRLPEDASRHAAGYFR